CDSRPSRSVSARVMPHFSAMSSAPWNCVVHSYFAKYDFGTALPTPSPRLDPIGTRLMSSTPHATATSTTPEATRLVARLVACCDEPHWLSTVVAAADKGSPAASHAVRVMLNACIPTWLTHPPMTWPTSVGSIPERSISSFCTIDSRSAEWNVDSPP